MKSEYKRLPGIGTGRLSFQIGIRNRIYQGPDHLLLVQSTGYTEEYRRIFYDDIRYVVIRKNQRYIWTSVFVGLMMLLIMLSTVLTVPLGVAIGLCVPLALVLVVNLLRGPTCSCYLATNVQTVMLPSPQRSNKVGALLDFLQGKITGAPAPQPVT